MDTEGSAELGTICGEVELRYRSGSLGFFAALRIKTIEGGGGQPGDSGESE